jgi:hypothetical protein
MFVLGDGRFWTFFGSKGCTMYFFTNGISVENSMGVSLIKPHFLLRFTIYSVILCLIILVSNGHFDISTGLVGLIDEASHHFSLFCKDTLSICREAVLPFCPDSTIRIRVFITLNKTP